MKLKRLAAALLCVLLALPTGAGAFYDTPPARARSEITALEEEGLFTGLSLDTTSASLTIRRGEFCKLLVNLVQKESLDTSLRAISPKSAGYFADLSNTVTSGSPGGKYDMYYAAAYDLTEGALRNGTRYADCNSSLTREQAAKMMCALVSFLNAQTGGQLCSSPPAPPRPSPTPAASAPGPGTR